MLLHAAAHPFWACYAILLLITGVTAFVLAFAPGEDSILFRIFMFGCGLAFGGYGVYVGFVNTSGSYYVSSWAIFVPALLLAGQVMRIVTWFRRKGATTAAPVPVVPYGQPPQAYSEPQPYGQLPQYGPPQQPPGQG
ncbi:hypothetical protein [Streptacidiphilus fuscans]|uniref:Uncharacterized protein n=1 Tax=Streptacidiphilus fuscans TaxID=2789292 RepID=A0A931B043_9ACTN|nr:hypothetical protein [Streptacidiphilus fuscans]MBF9067886.1 hypothetical protein [Streptacidiphilus fuscans]